MSAAPSMPALAVWSDQQLYQAVGLIDELIIKAVALPDYRQLAAKELRLREQLARSHKRIARKADDWLVKQVRAAKTEPSKTRINKWVNRWAKFFDGFLDENAEAIDGVVAFAQQAGKSAIYQRAFGAKRRAVYNGPPFKSREPDAVIPLPDETPVSKALAQIKPSTTLEDVQAIEQIQKGQKFWVGKYHNTVLNKQVRQIAQDTILEQGLPVKEAGTRLAQSLGYLNGYRGVKPEVPIPKGWTGSVQQYFDGVAANAATVSRIHGSMTAMVEMGFQVYEVISALDERTCPRCEAMNGAVIDVKQGYQHVTDVISATIPGAVKELNPWLSESEFLAKIPPHKVQADGSKIFSKAGMTKLIETGIGNPPFHFRCRCSIDVRPDTMTSTVTIPTSVVVPPKMRPVAPPKPAKTFIPGMTGKTAPGEYSSEKFAEAMANPEAAANKTIIRQQLNSFLYEERGLIPHSIERNLPMRREYIVDPNLKSWAAFNPKTGVIKVRPGVHRDALRFLNLDAKGQTSRATLKHFKAFRNDLHEGIHATTPAMETAYEGVGLFVEEASAEALARDMMIKRWGRFSFNDYSGTAYDSAIEGVKQALRNTWGKASRAANLKLPYLTPKQSQELLIRSSAGIRDKMIGKADMPKLPSEFVKRFAKQAAIEARDYGLTEGIIEGAEIARAFEKQFGDDFVDSIWRIARRHKGF